MSELVLFSKQYPFGKKETYIHNEISELLQQFEKIHIVPVDYYGDGSDIGYQLDHNRISIQLVNAPTNQTFSYKLRKNVRCLFTVLKEMIYGRDGYNHLLHFRSAMANAKVCYDQANVLYNGLFADGKKRVMYSYWFHRSVVTAAFLTSYFKPGMPLIGRAHSSDLYHKDWNSIIQLEKFPFMPFEWFKVSAVNRVYAITDHGAAHFKKIFPNWSAKFGVARLGVADPNRMNPLHDSSVFRLVTCSGITRNKRILRMPGVLAQLKEQLAARGMNQTVQWVHIGSATEENMHAIRNDMKSHGVEDMCDLKGWMNQDQIRNYYESVQVNVFLNISRAEGLPVSVMEAFSYGIPAIVTATVGNPEIVDESCGTVIPVDFNDDELVSEIMRLMLNPSLQDEWRSGALNKFQRDYNASKNYRDFASALANQMNEIE
jgi:glycosyltransferase involved in cell wall biosynthesis